MAEPRAAVQNLQPFASFSELKARHRELIELRRREPASEELFDRARGFVARGAATGARLDADQDRAVAQSLLDFWGNILFRTDHGADLATLEDFDWEQAPELSDADCPYQGLDSFRADRSHLFHGRDRLSRRLVEILRTNRFLAVVGPSGSGKSSVVMAGLVPRLRGGAIEGSDGWTYPPVLVPGTDPLLSLARAVLTDESGAALDDASPRLRGTRDGLLASPDHLASLLADGGRPALLVVDQFEELFTLTENKTLRAAFIANLLHLVELPATDHRVVVTMRSDFESHIATFPELQRLFEHSHARVTALAAGEIREAIERPAEQVGLRFEEGVVDSLVEDILGEPAALPLLQFSLLKLWEHRERNYVTWEAYQRLGGGRLALARSADAFHESLVPEDQFTARKILLRLVRPTEGFEIASGRLPRQSLFGGVDDAERVERVLDKLVAARLVRLIPGRCAEDDQVEIGHEALVRNWPLLVDWLEKDRQRLAERRRLEARAEEWVRRGGTEAGLLGEEELRDAERWLAGEEARELGVHSALPRLVERSREVIVARRRAAREREERELRQARELAETQRVLAGQRQNHLKSTYVALAVAIALIGGLIWQAIVANQQRDRATNLLEASAKAGTAAEQLDIDTRIGIATALEALGLSAKDRGAAFQSARSILFQALRRPAPRNVLPEPHRQTVFDLVTHYDSGRVATAEGDGRVRLWRWDPGPDGALELERELVHESSAERREVWGVAFSSDGEQLASAGENGQVKMWRVDDGQPLPWDGSAIARAHPHGVNTVAFSPDGAYLATGGEDSSPQLWHRDEVGARFYRTLEGERGCGPHRDRVFDVQYNPRGSHLATASVDGTAIVWTRSGRCVASLPHDDRVYSVAFSPDGSVLATASTDPVRRGIVRLWDSDSWIQIAEIHGHRDTVRSVTFNRTGDLLATASADGTAEVWDVLTGERARGFIDVDSLATLAAHRAPVWGVGFDPTSRRVATGGSTVQELQPIDRELRSDGIEWLGSLLWWQLPKLEHGTRITGLDTVLGSSRLATVDARGHVEVWSWNRGRPVESRAFDHADGSPRLAHFRVALSPGGRHVAAGGPEGTVEVWPLEGTDREPLRLMANSSGIASLTFVDGEKALVAATNDGLLLRWDLPGPEMVEEAPPPTVLARPETVQPEIYDLAGSPSDGSGILIEARYGSLRRWDLHAEPVEPSKYRSEGVQERHFAAAFRPDGLWFATADSDRIVRLWKTADGPSAVPIELRGHRAAVKALAFSNDGQRLATSSTDGEVRVWNLEELDAAASDSKAPADKDRLMLTLPPFTAEIAGLAFTPDGKHLLVASGRDLSLEPLELEQLTQEAAQIIQPADVRKARPRLSPATAAP